MKKGDTGKLVKVAQYIIGYTKDLGIFTKALEDKVISFQKLNGLKPNGIIDNNTFCCCVYGVFVEFFERLFESLLCCIVLCSLSKKSLWNFVEREHSNK